MGSEGAKRGGEGQEVMGAAKKAWEVDGPELPSHLPSELPAILSGGRWELGAQMGDR